MMRLTVSTANYYHLPFEQALEIIARAGFHFIELDLFWEWREWAMAQHLRGYTPREVVRQVNQAGLSVASIHDGGGVLDDPHSIAGFINPQLADYLDQLGYVPDSLVFHPPHLVGNLDGQWWRDLAPRVPQALEPYRGACQCLTLENMPTFADFYVPMINPAELLAFACQADLGVTLDTTHYAQIGTDIIQAAETLSPRVRTIHLSDYVPGKTHVFPGDGDLDWPAFFRRLDQAALLAITLECSPAHLGEDVAGLEQSALVERLKTARFRLEGWLSDANPKTEGTWG